MGQTVRGDGFSLTINDDNSSVQKFDNGKTITTGNDGVITTTYPNGDTETNYGDGTYVTQFADGYVVTNDTNSNEQITQDANGNVIDSSGMSADQSLGLQGYLPNGDTGGNDDGSTFPDSVAGGPYPIVVENDDGTSTTIELDGSTTTMDPEGNIIDSTPPPDVGNDAVGPADLPGSGTDPPTTGGQEGSNDSSSSGGNRWNNPEFGTGDPNYDDPFGEPGGSNEGGSDQGGDSSDPFGDGCFVAGTPVALPDGSVRPIDRIRPGDLVLAYNRRDCLPLPRRVTGVHAHVPMGVLALEVEGLAAPIRVTGAHRFFTLRGFRAARDLAAGEVLILLAGASLVERRLRAITPLAAPEPVYNLTVEHDHTYFVSGLLVHNEKDEDKKRSGHD